MAIINQYKMYGVTSTAASVEILTNPMVVEGNTVLQYTTAGTVTDGVVITISYLNIKKEVTT